MAVLWLCSVGCTTWRQATPPSATPLPREPADVRLHLADGSTREIRRARIQGDSLVGESTGVARASRVALALSDVRSLETRRFSRGRTAGLIGGLVAGGVALFVAVVGYIASTAST